MKTCDPDRLLRLIRALNEHGPCTVVSLNRETLISRQAIYRLLRVLCEAGYAKSLPDTHQYQLTSLVLELTDRVRDQERITEVATPVLGALQKRVVWPTSYADFEQGQMIVRVTTRRNSPLVFDRSRTGIRLPVLESSLGLAYLAFCAPPTRSTILNILEQSSDPLDRLARDPAAVKRLLRETVKRGYGSREGGSIGEATSSISVPVVTGRYAVGAVTTTFLTSALSIEDAARKFLSELQKSAAEISRHIG